MPVNVITKDLAPGALGVIDLLNYIEQVEKLKTKPAFSVPDDFFAAYQHELKSLPGIQFNLQLDGDVWLRIARLQEVAAPALDDLLQTWVILSKSPDKSPEIKPEIIILEGKNEVGRMNIDDHPEIVDLFTWYVEFQWEPWATTERPRRKTIAWYNKLFSLHQAISSGGADAQLELAWGIGYASWKKAEYATPVKYPLVVQPCEVTLNEKTFDLDVRPRDVEPRLEADCYAEMELAGVIQLEAYWRSALDAGVNRVNPFESSTFEGTLKTAVAYLDPSGEYEARTDDVTPPLPKDKLKITNSWVLFGRKRSGDIFLEDIRRLKQKIEEATSLPNVIRSFVEHGASSVLAQPEQPFRGLSTSDGGSNAMELFFPMAYNDEQVSIIQKLHANDGVVVQGPPGTGKTHTIANVICHYLAQGKRVLVTAKGESALAVLQEKLPDRIRPLCVALLSNEREGMNQFKHAIKTISSNVDSINPTRAAANIAAAEKNLNQLHAKISHVDSTVAAHANKHMQKCQFQGREVLPEELAKLVLEDAQAHEWFDDEPPTTKDGVLPFDDSEVVALRRARMIVGVDIGYLGCLLPVADNFPIWTDLLRLHRDLVKAKSIESSVTQGEFLALVDSRLETFENAQALEIFLKDRTVLKTKLTDTQQPWLDSLAKRFADMQLGDPLLQALLVVASDVHKLELQRRELIVKAVVVPADIELNSDAIDALNRLVLGKSAFALPFGKGEARKLISMVSVAGAVPSSKVDWELVLKALNWRTEARKILARWKSLSADFDLPVSDTGVEAGFKMMAKWQTSIEDIRMLTFDFDAKLHSRIDEVFGKRTADSMWDGGEAFIATVYSSLQAQVDKGRLAYAMKRMLELVRKLEGHTGKIVEELRLFLSESIGRPAADEA